MAKQKGILFASIAIIAILIAIIFGGCGQKPEDVPVDGSISQETETIESEEPVETPAPAPPEKETEEAPAPTEEEVVLTTDSYLTELSQGDCLEFKFSDYNSDYKVGNRITLSVTMESKGLFNGCIGTNVGSSYEWQQEEFDFEAGTHTATWTVTPSLDSAQLNLWFADSAPVGVISIEVAIEEVEPAVIGKLATFTEQDTFEFTLSEYNSLYKVGDLVKISVVLESDGDFNGSIGASVGKDYTWNQKEFQYDEGGKYTLNWTVKPSSDYSNIGIWWVGGTSVGIHSITVTVLEEEIGIFGDYITMFTDEGNFEFVPSLINPSFKFGDQIRITVTLESDGEFTGSLGTCVGDNYEWTQTEYESDTGISTWVLDISPVIDSVQLGIWYIGGTAVGIVDIDVEITQWSSPQHKTVQGLIYTSTQKNDTYTFKPSDYCDFEDGDIITIHVELDSNEVYNGCVSVTDINGMHRSANYSSNGGTVICELVVEASTQEEAAVEFWWMNTKVALNSITVTKGGTIVDTNDDDLFHPNEARKYRTAANYCDYKQGDTITVTVTLSGDGYFNGAIGMSGATWVQGEYESSDGSPVTCTIKVPNVIFQDNNIQIDVWWSEGSYVKIDNITVTKDSKPSDDEDDKPDEGEKIDTSDWQLAFNGFDANWGGWNSVNGITGKLELSAKIKDIMDANNITDINDFGGFLFQIWHVDSKYDGKTYSYQMNINGTTFKEGTGTIQCNEYNSTDVLQLTKDDYTFSPEDVISCVITVADAAEPSDAIHTFTYDKWAANKGDFFEFTPSQYGTFETGDTIIITVTFEPTSGYYNGAIGVNDADDNWIKTEQMEYTDTQWVLEVPNASKTNKAQVQMWWMNEGVSAKITDITVTKKEEEKAPIHTFTATGDFAFAPSQYCEFDTGDTIIITVDFESTSTQYNGTLGVSDATDTWITAGQLEGSNKQWVWEVPNASKNNEAQVQIWWMDNDVSVNITNITVTKKEEEKAPIHTFTATGDFAFAPSQYCEFNTGDTIIITVDFESTSTQYNGTLGVSDATDTWITAGQLEGSNKQWVWEVPNASKNNEAQVQIWWMDNDVSINITNITVTKKEEEKTPIHTFTYDEWKPLKDANQPYAFSFSPKDYGTFETGDTIIITVTFDQAIDYFDGTVGVSDATNNWKDTGKLDNSSNQWILEVPNASKDNQAQVQMWWMNNDVSAIITDITVTKKEEEKTSIHTFTYDEWKPLKDANQPYAFSFSPKDYGTFETGNTITITVTFDQAIDYFDGTVGVSDATNNWKDTGKLDNSSNQWVLEVPNASKDNQAQVQMWWMNNDVSAIITDITVTKKDSSTNTISLAAETSKLKAEASNSNGDKNITPVPDNGETEDVPTVSDGNATETTDSSVDTVSGNDAVGAETE